jgi:hypothetical protein
MNHLEGRVGGGLADELGEFGRGCGFGDKQDGRACSTESYAEDAGSVGQRKE